MNYEDRLQLLVKMKKLKIRACHLSELCNVSNAWISQWFNNPKVKISQKHQDMIVEYVNNYQK